MGYQKMADLRQERCTETAPFTYFGVDIYGPLIIKEGRSELKHYAVFLTKIISHQQKNADTKVV